MKSNPFKLRDVIVLTPIVYAYYGVSLVVSAITMKIYTGVGRKYNDNKITMQEKLTDKFSAMG